MFNRSRARAEAAFNEALRRLDRQAVGEASISDELLADLILSVAGDTNLDRKKARVEQILLQHRAAVLERVGDPTGFHLSAIGDAAFELRHH